MTLEHRRLAVTNLAHDFHRALAIRTEGHLRSGQERDDPQGPLASTALGGRSHDDVTICDGVSSCTKSAVDAAAARSSGDTSFALAPARWRPFAARLAHCFASDGKTGQPRGNGRSCSRGSDEGRSASSLGEARQSSESEQATKRSVAKLRVAVTARAKCGQCTMTASKTDRRTS
jgi:hypothetical protein